jgi:adenosylcobinamide-GDP ribazoletransferase
VRGDASAKSQPFADRLSGRDWALSGLIGVLAWGALALLDAADGGVLEARAWCAAALIAALAAALTSLAAAAYVRRRLGGYTGDCLGAVQQLAELAFLIGGLAALMPARRVG